MRGACHERVSFDGITGFPKAFRRLSEATAIARSASGKIGWYRDPLTERERRMRQRYLQQFFDEAAETDDDGPLLSLALRCSALRLDVLCERPHREVASDMRLAAASAEAILEQHRAERDAEKIAEIAAELDGEL